MKKTASKKGSSKKPGKKELYRTWRKNKEFQRIIDDFESGADMDNSPPVLLAVAGDYLTLGMANDDTEMYMKAMLMLRLCRDSYERDALWHHRMGVAENRLGGVVPALAHFLIAQELGNEDADAFIEECRLKISVPRFDRTFQDRVRECWEAFAEQEQEIAALIDAAAMPRTEEEAEEGEDLAPPPGAPAMHAAGERLAEIFGKALQNINIGTGTRRKKYMLTMSPRADTPTLLKLLQIRNGMPEALAERWEMRIGRPRYESGGSFGVGGDLRITPEDVRVWLVRDPLRPAQICVAVYCEKLVDMIREKSKDPLFMLEALIDYALGEVVSMRLIGPIDILDKPWKRHSFPLPELYGRLEKMGYDMEDDPEVFLKKAAKFFHQVNTIKPGEGEPRQDITDGWTLLPDLMQEYLDKNRPPMTFERLFRDGAAAGFIFFPTECFAGEEQAYEAVLKFVRDLEGFLRWKCGDCFVVIGKSSCATRFYLDLVVFGALPEVLLAAEDFFLNSPVRWASWRSYARQAPVVGIVAKKDYEL